MRTLVLAIVTIAVGAAALVLRGPEPDVGHASSRTQAPLIAENPSGANGGHRP